MPSKSSKLPVKYMILAYESQRNFEARGADDIGQQRQYWKAWQRWFNALHQAGILESMQSLLPEHTATTVRLRDGERRLNDGAYADTEEQPGGCFVIEVSDLDRVLEWAVTCPAASDEAVEIRPLMQDYKRAS